MGYRVREVTVMPAAQKVEPARKPLCNTLNLGIAALATGCLCPFNDMRINTTLVGLGIGITTIGLQPRLQRITKYSLDIIRGVYLSILSASFISLGYLAYKTIQS